ncbi:magnesium transporter [Pontibacter sp. G13]|uniref:magnesium transporter n=1 Tax=Pontibacter sp. G13 TaxID=3074898 RepID=UPI002889DCD5|nr:magnesium transporter [Pontibacter sp. G13]WNJ16074.1 magnesium transporter [Pontibacter sp. G13]
MEMEATKKRIDRVRRLLKSPNAHVRALLGVLHPAEVALVLEDSPPEIQERIIKELPGDLISEAISEMDEETKPGRLLTYLHPEIAAGLIKSLAPDDATDLLAQIPQAYKDKILYHMPQDDSEVIQHLLEYDEDTGGGLMNPDVVVVQENMTKLEALRAVVEQSEEMDEFYTIYVVDREHRLRGFLTFRSLFIAKNSALVRNIMDRDIISVSDTQDQEEVAKVMAKYNLPTLPVVDAQNHLLGRITFDDIMDVIEEENTEDILNFAGVSDGENLRGGWANAVKSRIPWLLINLCTASIAAYTISQFDSTIERLVILTSLMPIIAGVSGNGATQALAVTIRRISTDGIPRRKAPGVILKELSVGAINGLMLGAIVSMAASIVNPQFPTEFVLMLGVVVYLAMFGNLVLAGFAGSFIPIMLERLGQDPAVASSILITAFTDIIGYLLLFGLGSHFLLPIVNPLHDAGMNFISPF